MAVRRLLTALCLATFAFAALFSSTNASTASNVVTGPRSYNVKDLEEWMWDAEAGKHKMVKLASIDGSKKGYLKGEIIVNNMHVRSTTRPTITIEYADSTGHWSRSLLTAKLSHSIPKDPQLNPIYSLWAFEQTHFESGVSKIWVHCEYKGEGGLEWYDVDDNGGKGYDVKVEASVKPSWFGGRRVSGDGSR
ncbi:hypothetical protein HK102_001100 [Quaeritorhiza haematococci]|nr:hypothetical protein HK102_001100 [Quaeritorhiza haematococci]